MDWHSTARSEEIVDTSFVPTACPNSCRLHPSPSSVAGCAIKPKLTSYLHIFAQWHILKVGKNASRKYLWFSVCAPQSALLWQVQVRWFKIIQEGFRLNALNWWASASMREGFASCSSLCVLWWSNAPVHSALYNFILYTVHNNGRIINRSVYNYIYMIIYIYHLVSHVHHISIIVQTYAMTLPFCSTYILRTACATMCHSMYSFVKRIVPVNGQSFFFLI